MFGLTEVCSVIRGPVQVFPHVPALVLAAGRCSWWAGWAGAGPCAAGPGEVSEGRTARLARSPSSKLGRSNLRLLEGDSEPLP